LKQNKWTFYKQTVARLQHDIRITSASLSQLRSRIKSSADQVSVDKWRTLTKIYFMRRAKLTLQHRVLTQFVQIMTSLSRLQMNASAARQTHNTEELSELIQHSAFLEWLLANQFRLHSLEDTFTQDNNDGSQ
jgi:hypothetical protein